MNKKYKDEKKGIKHFFYWWLESENNPLRWIIDISLTLVIFLSIFVIVAEISIAPRISTSLIWLNFICLAIFTLEYLLRFWINTDFLFEARTVGIWRAIYHKFKWMLKPMSMVDLLSIIPALPVLRSFRLFRMIRLVRLLRLFKLGRYVGGGSFTREIKKRAFEIIIVAITTFAIILFSAIFLFCIEKPAGNEGIKTIWDAIWWSVVTSTTVGYGDIYPVTTLGRIIAIFPMFAGVGMAGAMTAIITGMIVSRIDALKSGKILQTNQSNHLLFCGWTPCAVNVADALYKSGYLDDNQLVVLAEENPERDDCIFIKGDKNNTDDMLRANADQAADVVIFRDSLPESAKKEDPKTFLSALHVFNTNQNCSITAELTDKNTSTLDIQQIEFVYKDIVDAEVILNSIRNTGHTSHILYDLASLEGNSFEIKKIDEIIPSTEDISPVTVASLKRYLIESELFQNTCFIACMKENSLTWDINPKNSLVLDKSTQICLVTRRGR